MIEAKEIGIKCIKFDCHNKSNQELENYIYTFQDLMYFYNGKQITIQAKEDILKTIETIGSKVKDIECDEKVEPRKQEFLTNMRKIYKNVRNTSVGQLKKEDVEKLGKYFSPNDKSYNRTGKPIDVKEPRWEIPISSLILLLTSEILPVKSKSIILKLSSSSSKLQAVNLIILSI